MRLIAAQAITAQHIKALRNADSVAFDFICGESIEKSVSTIRAIQEIKTSSTGFEQTVHIDVGMRWTDYTADMVSAPYSCFYYIHSSKYHIPWVTIANLLRPNDLLALEWTAQGGAPASRKATSYLEGAVTTCYTSGGNLMYTNAPLFWDELEMVVIRGTKTEMKFSISHGLCPNNSARMIKTRRVL